MNRKQVQGLFHGFAGKIEHEAGKFLGNNDLRHAGMSKMIVGRIERTTGSATEMIKAALRRH